MRSFSTFLFVGVFAVTAGTVGAATLEIVQTTSVPVQSTNYIDVAAVPSIDQFDSSLGTLQSVMLTLTGTVEGSAQIENFANQSGDISWSVQADMSAGVAGFSVSKTIGSGGQFSAGAFDGNIDFAGTSGFFSGPLSTTDTMTGTSSNSAVLDLFTGLGTVDILVSAQNTSGVLSSPGNVVSIFSTRAGAAVEVKYTYEEAATVIPLPAGLPLLVAGLGVLGLMRRGDQKA